MAEVRPFQGIRYTSWIARDADRLICPPYDMGPERRRIFRARHPYNAVWLEVPEGGADDTPDNNRYTRAGDTFRRWIDEGFLARDPSPSFYLLRQRFRYEGVEHTRLALVAAVRLEEFDKGVILPHEYTMPGPIQDRLSLTRACRANFSPLMVLYRDPQESVGALLQAAAQGDPDLVAQDAEGHLAELWVVSDPNIAGTIQRTLEGRTLYMADGHHRYEAALAYRDEMRHMQGGTATGSEAYNYAMLALIAFDDPALLVFPYHRLLRGLRPSLLDRVWSELRELFEVSPCDVDGASLPDALLERMSQGAIQRPTIGMIQGQDQAAYLLTLREGMDVPHPAPPVPYEGWLLEKALQPALGDSLRHHTAYLQDGSEALQKMRSGEGQLAFFLRSIPLELFQSVVSQGRRLPPKSTNFYPKLPTGLVFRSLEGGL